MAVQDRSQVCLGIQDKVTVLLNTSKDEQERLMLGRAIKAIAAAEAVLGTAA